MYKSRKEKLRVSIFNRWEELIYFCEKTDLISFESTLLCNGIYQGKSIPNGIYSIRIDLDNFENKSSKWIYSSHWVVRNFDTIIFRNVFWNNLKIFNLTDLNPGSCVQKYNFQLGRLVSSLHWFASWLALIHLLLVLQISQIIRKQSSRLKPNLNL
jgi:hypothetical protein